jgi:hypothetical protein
MKKPMMKKVKGGKKPVKPPPSAKPAKGTKPEDRLRDKEL